MAYIVSGTDLTAVANAIRTAGETSAPLEFPSGFVTAIGNISGGGGGGASNIIVGSFTGSAAEKGSVKAVSVDYSGNGYPIVAFVYPKDGYKDGSTLYTSTDQKAITMLAIVKSDMEATPTYDTSNTEKNFAHKVACYKYSNSDPTNLSGAVSKGAITFTSYAPNSSAATNAIRFSGKNTMNVLIKDTNYGFLDGIEYEYLIVYSE